MKDVKWFKAKKDNDDGIKTIAFTDFNEELRIGRIVGYNGILKGDKIEYEGKEYTVVMVSRMGDFGLSETGKLPYTVRVSPRDVKKCTEEKPGEEISMDAKIKDSKECEECGYEGECFSCACSVCIMQQ